MEENLYFKKYIKYKNKYKQLAEELLGGASLVTLGDKIYGPYVFHYYELDQPEFIKRIMLFGERHINDFEETTDSNSMNMIDFLNKLFNKGKCYDFFQKILQNHLKDGIYLVVVTQKIKNS